MSVKSDDISFPLPDRKFVGKHFMKTSMKKCLSMYNLAEATKHKISLSTLYQIRPKSVKLKGKIPLGHSCCEKCLKFDNVAKEAFTYLTGTSKDLHEAVDLTLCPYTGTYPKFKCILCTHSECGTSKLKQSLIEKNSAKLQDTRQRFLIKQWVNKSREKNGVTQNFLQWDVDWCSYAGLTDKYVELLEAMAEHVFMASWNYGQFKIAKNNHLWRSFTSP